MDSHFSKLQDSLIEICVVVGMDHDTGLVQTLSPEVSFFCRIIRWEAFGQDLFFCIKQTTKDIGYYPGILIKHASLNKNRLFYH